MTSFPAEATELISSQSAPLMVESAEAGTPHKTASVSGSGSGRLRGRRRGYHNDRPGRNRPPPLLEGCHPLDT